MRGGERRGSRNVRKKPIRVAVFGACRKAVEVERAHRVPLVVRGLRKRDDGERPRDGVDAVLRREAARRDVEAAGLRGRQRGMRHRPHCSASSLNVVIGGPVKSQSRSATVSLNDFIDADADVNAFDDRLESDPAAAMAAFEQRGARTFASADAEMLGWSTLPAAVRTTATRV